MCYRHSVAHVMVRWQVFSAEGDRWEPLVNVHPRSKVQKFIDTRETEHAMTYVRAGILNTMLGKTIKDRPLATSTAARSTRSATTPSASPPSSTRSASCGRSGRSPRSNTRCRARPRRRSPRGTPTNAAVGPWRCSWAGRLNGLVCTVQRQHSQSTGTQGDGGREVRNSRDRGKYGRFRLLGNGVSEVCKCFL